MHRRSVWLFRDEFVNFVCGLKVEIVHACLGYARLIDGVGRIVVQVIVVI